MPASYRLAFTVLEVWNGDGVFRKEQRTFDCRRRRDRTAPFSILLWQAKVAFGEPSRYSANASSIARRKSFIPLAPVLNLTPKSYKAVGEEYLLSI